MRTAACAAVGFNPTLVRFEPALPRCASATLAAVSIPHWSDLSCLRLGMPRAAAAGFNPTLVRFEPALVALRAVRVCGFNPTLVRFERSYARSPGAAPSSVSIPHWSDLSRHASAGMLASAIGFNPTLVRFEPHSGCHASVCACDGFNPTLVRFEPCTCTSVLDACDRVSIPHWSDLSRTPLRRARPLRAVSIPHWSDLSLLLRATQRMRCDGFNPTLVRFEPAPAVGATVHQLAVSIPHWSDLSRCRARRRRSDPTVSIPHWSDLSSTARLRSLSTLQVSIPHWSDLSQRHAARRSR